MKTFKKVLKATVPMRSAGLMKALVLAMFFVSLLFLNSCANLIDAARKGDTARVNALLNKGADVNAKDKNGNTALIVASEKGHTEVVKALIDKGADVNARHKDGWTALIWACGKKGHPDTVKLLLDKGADVNAKDYKYGVTALMEASEYGQTETVKLLLAKGADVNVKTTYGGTALMWASEKGHADIVKALLNKGADVNVKNKDGRTPLMWASEKGRPEIVSALLAKGADINSRISKKGKDWLRGICEGDTALALALRNNHNDIAKILLNSGANPNNQSTAYTVEITPFSNKYSIGLKTYPLQGETPLLRAILQGNIEMVKLLLEKGTDPNAAFINSDIEIVRKKMIELERFTKTGILDDVPLAAGAKIYVTREKYLIVDIEEIIFVGFGPPSSRLYKEYPAPSFTTAISEARKKGHTEIVQLLKAAGARE